MHNNACQLKRAKTVDCRTITDFRNSCPEITTLPHKICIWL